MSHRLLLPTVLLILSACGSKQSSTKPTTPAPEELFPEAPAASCMNIPVVGSDIEMKDVTPDEIVAIDGTPTAGPRVCTTLVCEDACCNSCAGGYVVSIAVERTATAVALTGLDGCSGNDCRVDCEPFGTKPKTEYRFVGTIIEETLAGARFQMKVNTFCMISPSED